MSNRIIISKNLSNEDLGDIIAAGVEGGIGYWADVVTPAKGTPERAEAEDYWMIVPNGGSITIIEDHDSEEHILNKYNLMLGIQRAIDFGDWDGEDTCDIDSDVADKIIQYALFSSLIYG